MIPARSASAGATSMLLTLDSEVVLSTSLTQCSFQSQLLRALHDDEFLRYRHLSLSWKKFLVFTQGPPEDSVHLHDLIHGRPKRKRFVVALPVFNHGS